MLKRSKSKKKSRKAPEFNRVLVVDDDADAGKLVAQILRTAGYEVGELNDAQVAFVAITAEPEKIGAVILSFTHSGATACLKMLDGIRSHPDPRVSQLRVVIILDSPRQQLFTWQSGADEVLARPYHSTFLVGMVGRVLLRSQDQRHPHRREMILAIEQGHAEQSKSSASHSQAGSIQFS